MSLNTKRPILESSDSKSSNGTEVDFTHLVPSMSEMAALQLKPIGAMSVADREQALFGNGFTFSDTNNLYGRGRENVIAKAPKTDSADEKQEAKPSVSLSDWMQKDGSTLAKMAAEITDNGGLMVLGPADTMRKDAEAYKDPDGSFPVFTHASPGDFHMYYGVHQLKKQYSVETLAALIKENVPQGQPIKLLGCESGVHGGIARELSKLLPDNPVFAPDGYCELKDGKATVYKKKPSEVPWGETPPLGEFVVIPKN